MLLTIDEARRVIVASAGNVLAYAACPDNGRLEAVLWGRDEFEGESVPDQALAGAHRRVLRHLEDLGYGADVAEELEGVCSAAGLDDGCRDYDFIFDVLGEQPLDFAGGERFWPWPFAA